MMLRLFFMIGIFLVLCDVIHHAEGADDVNPALAYWYYYVPIFIVLKVVFWTCWCYLKHKRREVVVIDRRVLCDPQNQDLPDRRADPPPYAPTRGTRCVPHPDHTQMKSGVI